MSFKPEVIAAASGKWCGNALCFVPATHPKPRPGRGDAAGMRGHHFCSSTSPQPKGEEMPFIASNGLTEAGTGKTIAAGGMNVRCHDVGEGKPVPFLHSYGPTGFRGNRSLVIPRSGGDVAPFPAIHKTGGGGQ
jgi:hypothetical protein